MIQISLTSIFNNYLEFDNMLILIKDWKFSLNVTYRQNIMGNNRFIINVIFLKRFRLVLQNNSSHSTLNSVKCEKQICHRWDSNPRYPAFQASVLLLDHKGFMIEFEQHRG